MFEAQDNFNTVQHFAVEFEDFKTWAEECGIVKDGIIVVGRKKLNLSISMDEVASMYEYAKENKKPCPIIVNYKRKKGHFVFRRWVAILNDDFSNINIIEDSGAPFDGLHNTNLKEDGKWFPNAEDYESIISFAYNKKHNLFETDTENITYVTKQEPTADSKAEQLMYYYVANAEVIDGIVDKLPNDCGKMCKLSNKDQVTSEWEKLGHYREDGVRPNTVPKTDILSEKYNISVKEAGGSQLASGYEQESRATLVWAAEQLGDEEVLKKVNSLFETPWLRNINSTKDADKRAEAQDKNRDMTKVIKELWENREFKYLVIKEAMTGAVKFGRSDKAANCVFVWDEVNPGNSKLYEIEEYINHVIDNSVVIIALKTATKTSTAFRIITK